MTPAPFSSGWWHAIHLKAISLASWHAELHGGRYTRIRFYACRRALAAEDRERNAGIAP
jgi:hypothetical protein